MAKYRKKPVIIEAEKVSKLLNDANTNFGNLPQWVQDNYKNGNIILFDNHLSIMTLEGKMKAEYDDYLIQGVNGEIYPCKPDIFEKTYDIVNE